MVKRICQQCNIEYETYPSVRLLYCSQSCAGEAKRTGEYIQCAQCGKQTWSHPSHPKTYCSRSCARTARNLTGENPSYHRDVSGENNPMYGKGMKGADNPMFGKRKEKSPRWKGGRKIRKDGYVLVVAPDNHPYPADSHKPSGLKYILEHRLVMEQHLGRYLGPKEVVHHIDGNPSNNVIDNLQLFASQEDHIRKAHGGTA